MTRHGGVKGVLGSGMLDQAGTVEVGWLVIWATAVSEGWSRLRFGSREERPTLRNLRTPEDEEVSVPVRGFCSPGANIHMSHG